MPEVCILKIEYFVIVLRIKRAAGESSQRPRPDGPHAQADPAARFSGPRCTGLTQGRTPVGRDRLCQNPVAASGRRSSSGWPGGGEHGRLQQKTSGEVLLLWVTPCHLCCSTPGSRASLCRPPGCGWACASPLFSGDGAFQSPCLSLGRS